MQISTIGRLPKQTQIGICPFREFLLSLKGSNMIVWCLLIRAKRILSSVPLEALKNICSKIQFLSKQRGECSIPWPSPQVWSHPFFKCWCWCWKKEKNQHLTFFPPSSELLNVFLFSPLPPHLQIGCLNCHMRGCSFKLTVPFCKLKSSWVAGAAGFYILNLWSHARNKRKENQGFS